MGRDVAYEPAAALPEDETHGGHPAHPEGSAQGSASPSPCPCLPPSLTFLSLARSVVHRVPPGLAALSALRSLDLTRCRLLPEHQGLPFLAQLPSLEELNCSWCVWECVCEKEREREGGREGVWEPSKSCRQQSSSEGWVTRLPPV